MLPFVSWIDASAVSSTLTALENAADDTENLFPFILEAVKAEATVGEICGTLARHFGRYREQSRTG